MATYDYPSAKWDEPVAHTCDLWVLRKEQGWTRERYEDVMAINVLEALDAVKASDTLGPIQRAVCVYAGPSETRLFDPPWPKE